MGSSISKFFESAGSLLIGCAFVFCTTYGVYHAFNKHDTGAIALFFPPYAWYLAIEGVGWHDDFSGVDWEKRSLHDQRAISVFLMASINPDAGNILEVQEQIEKFSKKIAKYPPEKTRGS